VADPVFFLRGHGEGGKMNKKATTWIDFAVGNIGKLRRLEEEGNAPFPPLDPPLSYLYLLKY